MIPATSACAIVTQFESFVLDSVQENLDRLVGGDRQGGAPLSVTSGITFERVEDPGGAECVLRPLQGRFEQTPRSSHGFFRIPAERSDEILAADPDLFHLLRDAIIGWSPR